MSGKMTNEVIVLRIYNIIRIIILTCHGLNSNFKVDE